MSWFARLMYAALEWKERQRARRVRRGATAVPAEHGTAVGAHLVTGRRGETLAYWYLRQAGYTMVARNRRPGVGAGELDLVGWDGPVLAFVEVKTRTSEQAGPPEAAVTPEQRRRIVKAARAYLSRIRPREVAYRFDIASVYWDPQAGYRVRLVKDAFKER